MNDDIILSIEPVIDVNEERILKTDLKDWLDSQDLMQMLHISKKKLQIMRSKGQLPFSRFGYKIYYLRSDILQIFANNYQHSKDYGSND